VARTPLLRALRKLFADAHLSRKTGATMPAIAERRERVAEPPRIVEPPRITRRTLAAGVGAAAASLALPRAVRAKGNPRIAIVGGGIAGLTCALKLADRGIPSTVYEASGRFGGRMFSNQGYWNDGQVTEWFGELIDSGHETVRALAKRFKLPLDDLHAAEPTRSQDTYYFFRSYYTQQSATFDFLADVAERVAADAEAAGYPTTFDSFTPEGAELDGMSVWDWIESRVPGGHDSELGQLLDAAYNTEYGAETRDQSALNLVYLLGFQPDEAGLSVFGESDEAFRIRGGNQQLPLAIAKQLQSLELGWSLKRLRQNAGGSYALDFERGAGTTHITADYVVLALPFAVLRTLDIAGAGFDALKLRAIRELGSGRNAKTQLQLEKRIWSARGAWPGVSNGSSYSDTGYQSSWESTRAQPGKSGILVFYSGGNTTSALKSKQPVGTAADSLVAADVATTLRRAEPVFPGLTRHYCGKATESIPHLSPFYRNSYAYYRTGQYLDFAGYEKVAQGGVLFCGEHTSQDYQGFMEGGASEGKRAARQLSRVITGKADAKDDI
jgi:monoamine oxidase